MSRTLLKSYVTVSYSEEAEALYERCKLLKLYRVGCRRIKISVWNTDGIILTGGKLQCSEKKPMQYHFVREKSHMDKPEIQRESTLWNAGN
jgi:hypothetical protein